MAGISRRRALTAAVAGAAIAILAGCAPAPATPAPQAPSTAEPFPSEIPAGVSNFAPEGTSVIFLVRHGRTDANDQNLVQGWSDTPLNAQGQAQAAAAAERIGPRLETGTVFMNRCDYLDPALAWTGVKDSGRGVTLSSLGYAHLTRPKSYHLKLPEESR